MTRKTIQKNAGEMVQNIRDNGVLKYEKSA